MRYLYIMLIIKLIRSYTNTNEDNTAKINPKTGRNAVTFVYTVHGSKDELEEYKACQGEHYRTNDNGVPLFFTQRPAGKTSSLNIYEGKVSIDTTDMDLAAAMIENFGAAGLLKAKQVLGVIQSPAMERQQIEGAANESLD